MCLKFVWEVLRGYNHIWDHGPRLGSALSLVVDAISMRLRLPVFSASVCSVPSDIGHLCASCHHLPYGGGKGPIAQSNPRCLFPSCSVIVAPEACQHGRVGAVQVGVIAGSPEQPQRASLALHKEPIARDG